MMDYVVYSMPRCMSLWLSHALTFGDNVCYHDISLDRNPPFASGTGRTGTCETAIIGGISKVDKILLLVRDPNESISSLKAAYNIDTPELRKAIRDSYELYMSLDHKIIHWKELTKAKIVQDTQDYLIGQTMPIDRIETLLQSKITVSKKYLNGRMSCLGEL